ncbi:hypothetical protein NZL82_13245 [Sphingomonas sanguinis]|uniref:hypothetical protein n=1 Tax=Sphingomonas sp. LC-1 TaxID=3110957 RepID=UPI0021BB9B83|nr:hypothetical protein [Sphingomonas sp. LC-1]MCT8002840.1 hypothetical protein [Sphingomonas sp. LC-1]
MDELLRQAYERRERLRQELKLVENLIADYLRLEAHTLNRAKPANYELSLEAPASTRQRLTGAELNNVMDAAEAVIAEAGKPLSRSELMDRLESQGFHFPGTDKTKVFGTNLWRSKRFLNLKGIGYWPKGVPLPAKYQSAEKRHSMLSDPD